MAGARPKSDGLEIVIMVLMGKAMDSVAVTTRQLSAKTLPGPNLCVLSYNLSTAVSMRLGGRGRDRNGGTSTHSQHIKN